MARRTSPLHNALRYLVRGRRLADGWVEENPRDRAWEDLYRGRWQHDRVVRSTHGVNCTGSCSWKVYVKDGIITWETQQTDYPSLGPDFPEYEPRGCARGASFSWYVYSPLRIKYPYVRGVLWRAWQAALAAAGDPVAAWAQVVEDPETTARIRSARGKGGFVRVGWDDVSRLVAAAVLHTLERYGPDRIAGFSPIPAMSMVSYTAGSRFISLLGGTMLSFYDWYADLPPASPQVWGEQTDVPESADWFNAGYIIVWGTNLPMTRTPDAHFLAEARYHGTKVVAVSPDYAEVVKFADQWLAARPGTDGALAMAMTYVILKEFYIERSTPYFEDYVRRYTDLPFLVRLVPRDAEWVPDRYLTAADLGWPTPYAHAKPLVWDAGRDGPAVPKGTIGHRWEDRGRWNLRPEDEDGRPIAARLTFRDEAEAIVPVAFPYFGDGPGRVLTRPVPVRDVTVRGQAFRVTTVFDLLVAHVGVARGLPGESAEEPPESRPYTPAWQEAITGVPRDQVERVAREFADNAARTRGRSLIAMGAGTNHWYHSDVTYRAMLNLVLLTGCQGVNGGGWAHYVGQEKVRPLEGWSTLAFAQDWVRPPRQQNGTLVFYFASGQHRYPAPDLGPLYSPLAHRLAARHPQDLIQQAVRRGWLPFYPQFDRNPVAVVDEARQAGARQAEEIVRYVREALATGRLRWAIEDPDRPENGPKVLFVWRGNLLGASGKGHEYLLKHLLGADGHVLGRPDGPSVNPGGRLDLFVNLDFRMTSTGLYADVVLPAATWYEKTDLSSTDMHPFVHPFNPAVAPMWDSRTDWDAFVTLAEAVSALARDRRPVVEDIVATPLLHDTPDEVPPARSSEEAVDSPTGPTEPRFVVVRRDLAHLAEQMTAVGPLVETGYGAKGIRLDGRAAYRELREYLGACTDGVVSRGCPAIRRDRDVADAILLLSGTTNGRRAMEAWQALERTTGLALTHLASGRAEERYTLEALSVQPRPAIVAPVWSGIEREDRRYAPFTVNVEALVPWRTFTGRQHVYLDHPWMQEFGETLPLYRPPLGLQPFGPGDHDPGTGGRRVMVRYLTPHQKWGIHSTYTDTPRMLTLFRGGQTIWISPQDAEILGIRDNDWIEAYNQNGAVVARAVVSHRIPAGVAFMYHAQDRTIGVPKSAVTGGRGGTHNSLTRILPKPTHLIGGWAQLSYGFNYYGPTGHQRDTMVWLRPLGEVDWLDG
ncbi:MAG: nitrate reductase subunit alpha [Actinomycetia bacterium]|nr:nitrate reductase subunit alpha [Actinomycetes bacterium]